MFLRDKIIIFYNIKKLLIVYILIILIFFTISNWGLGIGDWGLGIGDWAQSPITN